MIPSPSELMLTDAAMQHSKRFRKVSTRYPLRVTEAYEGNLERAMADNDEQVAATVAAWERHHGLPPRDWPAIGGHERAEPGSLDLEDVERMLRRAAPACVEEMHG